MFRSSKRRLLAGLSSLLAFAALPAAAQEWPARPIKLITQYATGGTADLTARLVAEKLGQRLHTPVIVDNRSGGGGRIGAQAVAHAAPDGYTLLWTAAIHTTNAAFFNDLGYDTEKDFVPVIHAFRLPAVLVVSASSPVHSVADYLATVKADAQWRTIAHSGLASVPHLSALQFATAAGFQINGIAYKGDIPAVQDLLGGHVDSAFVSIGTPVPHIQAGKLRALAVSGSQRSHLLPDVPTFAQAGVQGIDSFAWFGMLAPAGTPAPIVDRLNAEINQILKDPALLATAGQTGAVPIGGSPGDFQAFITKDIAKWKQLAKTTGLKLTSY